MVTEKEKSINKDKNGDDFTTLLKFNVTGLDYTVYLQENIPEDKETLFPKHRLCFNPESNIQIPINPVEVSADRVKGDLVLNKVEYRSTVMGVEIGEIIAACLEELDKVGVGVTIL